MGLRLRYLSGVAMALSASAWVIMPTSTMRLKTYCCLSRPLAEPRWAKVRPGAWASPAKRAASAKFS